MTKAARLTMGVGGLILLLAVGFTISSTIGAQVHSPLAVKLSEALPADIANWSYRDIPLGPTEFSAAASKKILGFDDYINREYTSGSIRVGVYIAYWKPGKLTARMVRGHVPDNCWVAAGWHMQRPANPRIKMFPGLEFERRTFTEQNRSLDVAYVQIVGGKVHTFSKAQASGLGDDLMHYWDWRSAGPKEQYFIRISSSESLEKLSQTLLMRTIHSFTQQYAMHVD